MLFGRRPSPTPEARQAPRPAAPAEAPHPSELWRDTMGRLATRSIQIIAVVILAVGVIWAARSITVVVIPVILALIFASAFEPIMKRLRRAMPNALATVIVLVAIVLILGGVVYAMVASIIGQWSELYDSAATGVAQVIDWVNTLPIVHDQSALDEIWGQIQSFLSSSSLGSTLSSGAVAVGGAVANFVTGLVLMVVVLFFFLKDGPLIWAFLLRPFRGENYERMRRIGDKTVGTIGAYVRGTAAVAAVDAIGIGIGLVILQVPLWFPLMLVVFVLAFIPIVGATLAGILAALVGLVDGGIWTAVIIVAIVVVVNQLEGNLLQPVLMGRALQLHALVILVALTIGTVLSGILGAILAVPLAAVLWGIVLVWDGPDTPARWARRKPDHSVA
ncbi:AI-2E family transporter [Microbacterium indicum]|uniref:AI-2E family transporter n=1 Tax=Microbacterium indicum TaxID=358100 RepID=UPI0004200BA0|nr:AI-2E family transporter [Microbacterium indicum]